MDSYAYYVHSPYSFNGPIFVPRSNSSTGLQHTNLTPSLQQQQQQSDLVGTWPISLSSSSQPAIGLPNMTTPVIPMPMPWSHPASVSSSCHAPSFPQRESDGSNLMVVMPPPLSFIPSPSSSGSKVPACSFSSLCSTQTSSASSQRSSNYLMAPAHPRLQSPTYIPPTPAAAAVVVVPTPRALALSLIPSRMGSTPTSSMPARPVAEIVRTVAHQHHPVTTASNNNGFSHSSASASTAGLNRTVSSDSTSAMSDVSIIPDSALPISPQSLQMRPHVQQGDLIARPAGKPQQQHNTLLTVPGCCHKKEWKRLRSKKGFGYYRCELCGAKWKTAGAARCANPVADSPLDEEEESFF